MGDHTVSSARKKQTDDKRKADMLEARRKMQEMLDKQVEEAKAAGHTVKKRKVNHKEEAFKKTAAYIKATTGDWSNPDDRKSNFDPSNYGSSSGGGGVSSWNNP